MRCETRDYKSKLVASGHREGSLYYLDYGGPVHCTKPVQACSSSKETIWHHGFGYLKVQGMKVVLKNKMVRGLDFDWKQTPSFCGYCAEGKNHQA